MQSIYDDLECLPPAHAMTGRGSGDAPQGPKQGDPAGPAGGTAAAAPGAHILVDCAGEGRGLATKGEILLIPLAGIRAKGGAVERKQTRSSLQS
jgi:hypothetical protein